MAVDSWCETPGNHLPSLFLSVITELTDRLEEITSRQATRALRLATKILTRVQPAVVAAARSSSMPTTLLQSCLTKYEK